MSVTFNLPTCLFSPYFGVADPRETMVCGSVPLCLHGLGFGCGRKLGHGCGRGCVVIVVVAEVEVVLDVVLWGWWYMTMSHV